MKSKGVFNKLRILKSMKLGIFLLSAIMFLSVLGTILPQGREPAFYLKDNPGFIARLILILGFDHIYTSRIFAVLFSALAVNMLLCNTARLGSILNRLRKRFDMEHMMENVSYLGSWFLHLGFMLVVLFYIYGQASYYSQELYGVTGEIRSVENTDFKVNIKDFKINYREDGSISQYTTKLDVLDSNDKLLMKGSSSVNSPMRWKGYSFYQTGTGWAAECKAYKDDSPLEAEVLYEGLAYDNRQENIAIVMTKLYPDFAADDKGLYSLSDRLENPVFLYSIYYRGDIVRMSIAKPGESIKWNEYSFVFDNPQRYTFLKVNRMKGQFGAAMGGMFIVFGLLLVFYFKPAYDNEHDKLSSIWALERIKDEKEEGMDVR
ncbi:MAG: ResB protein required for cytochrome c biosynthesis-like protein [Clostridia bacterium]|nr:ResB protein required for cytochrome c biosynthesis-like protein [Clostridia bacterium]